MIEPEMAFCNLDGERFYARQTLSAAVPIEPEKALSNLDGERFEKP